MKRVSFLLPIIFFVIYTIHGQPKEESKGKVIGEFFGDYFYKMQGDTGILLEGPGQYQKTEKDFHGFEIRRFNLGYEYDFNNTFKGKLMLEGNDDFVMTNQGKRSVYIKYAYLEWKNIFKGSKLTIGAQSTPTFSVFTEKIWSYRSVEKTMLDFHKHASSNDLGISLSGDLLLSGSVTYYFMVGNGKSTSIEDDKYKRIYGSVHGQLFNDHLLFQVYTDYERKDKGVDVYILKGFLGYRNDRLTVAVGPYNRIVVDESVNENESALGLTLFARGSIVEEKLNGFYRIDLYDEDINTTDLGYRETFMVFGVDYTPFQKINVIPNIWITGYRTKDNVTPGRKSDVVARVTFRYKI